jgi:hypothetical protein
MTIKNLEATVTQQVAEQLDEKERQRQNRKILKELARTQDMLRKKFYEDVESTSEETEVEQTVYDKKAKSFATTKSKKETRQLTIPSDTKDTLRQASDKALLWQRFEALMKPPEDLITKTSI